MFPVVAVALVSSQVYIGISRRIPKRRPQVRLLFSTMLTLLTPILVVLVIYDYVVTIPGEINFMWPARMSRGRVLFFVIRYLVLGKAILIHMSLWHHTVDVSILQIRQHSARAQV